MNADEHIIGSGVLHDIDHLHELVTDLRRNVQTLTERADASGSRADASEARDVITRCRVDATENRQDIVEDRADACEAREMRAKSKVDALEAITTKHHLRIVDLEAHVDIDRQMIMELQATDLVAQDQVQHLREALQSSRVIGQAPGLVMARLCLT